MAAIRSTSPLVGGGRFRDGGTVELREAEDLRFLLVSAGTGSIDGPARASLSASDALALPPGPFRLIGSPGLEIVELTSRLTLSMSR